MLEYLIRDNKLWPEFEKYGLREQDLDFIKEQIFETDEAEVRNYITKTCLKSPSKWSKVFPKANMAWLFDNKLFLLLLSLPFNVKQTWLRVSCFDL